MTAQPRPRQDGVAAKRTARALDRGSTRAALYECRTCGATFDAWDAADAHADECAGARIRWLGGR